MSATEVVITQEQKGGTPGQIRTAGLLLRRQTFNSYVPVFSVGNLAKNAVRGARSALIAHKLLHKFAVSTCPQTAAGPRRLVGPSGSNTMAIRRRLPRLVSAAILPFRPVHLLARNFAEQGTEAYADRIRAAHILALLSYPCLCARGHAHIGATWKRGGLVLNPDQPVLP